VYSVEGANVTEAQILYREQFPGLTEKHLFPRCNGWETQESPIQERKIVAEIVPRFWKQSKQILEQVREG
jgi:hypothetical protein